MDPLMREIKVGIVGCGNVAKAHLAAYQRHGATVVALADPSAQNLSVLAESAPGAKTYASYRDLLAAGEVEAISLCTPPHLHREVAVAALEAGVHLLCEKPLAATLEDARAMEAAATASKAFVMMAFRHRFLPAHQWMKQRLAQGDLGNIVLFKNIFGGPAQAMAGRWFCQRAIAGGGVLLDTSVHGLDLFRFYCGEVESANAQMNRAFEGTDVEDSGILSVRAASGALGVMVSSWNIGTGAAEVEIYTDRAHLSYRYADQKIVLRRAGVSEPEIVPVEVANGFNEQTAHFLASLREGKAPLPSLCDGLRAAEILSEIYSGTHS